MIDGDHPIFDGPFGHEGVLPSFVELGDRRFKVRFEWREDRDRYLGDGGWIAEAQIDGQTIRSNVGAPIRCLYDLVGQLHSITGCDAKKFKTDMPIQFGMLKSMYSNTR